MDPKEIVERMYIGETSRTIKVRSNQHQMDIMRCSTKLNLEPGTSFMWDHYLEAHGDPTAANSIDPKKDFSSRMMTDFTLQGPNDKAVD